MIYPSSANLTRLIDRLIATTNPEAMTLSQLRGLSNALAAADASDPSVIRLVTDLAAYQQQLTETQGTKQLALLGATPGQLDLYGNETAA